MILFYDTETTGLINFKRRSHDPSQPHLVQLAALLMDNDGREIQSLNFIIEPDGYEIPKEASDIHGITTEYAKEFGVPLGDAVRPFMSLAGKATRMVGHNIAFDKRVLKIARSRLPYIKFPEIEAEDFCTMHKSRKPVGLGKVPKLMEAYESFFGEKFIGAHGAMDDTRACARVYYHLIKTGAAE